MLQSASTTTMHLNILTGFQLRIREALRWVRPISHLTQLRKFYDACSTRGCAMALFILQK